MTEYSDLPPTKVHISSSDIKLSGEKRPVEYRTAHRTIVLNAANPTYELGGYDPARCEIYLNVLDNPVVLSGSYSEASDLANTTGTMTAPNGRILGVSNGSEYCIKGQDEQWVSTNTYPTRVGITVVREI